MKRNPVNEAQPHRSRCGAKTRQATPCLRWPARGRDRCRLHGGASPAGIASPQFKHGLRSKYLTALPRKLQAGYQALRSRDDMLELSNEIALVDVRLLELVGRIDSRESSWGRLRAAFARFREARSSKNLAEEKHTLRELGAAIEHGAKQESIWEEITQVLESRRRLVESERRRLVEQQEMMTAQEAALLFTTIIEAVNKNVTDSKVKAKIQADIVRIADHRHIDEAG